MTKRVALGLLLFSCLSCSDAEVAAEEPDCAELAEHSGDDGHPLDTAGRLDGRDLVWGTGADGLGVPSPITVGDFYPSHFELYRAAGMDGPSDLDATPRPLDFGFFWPPIPAAEETDTEITCFSEGTISAPSPDRVEVRSRSAELLGTCPGGTPVDGELQFCSGTNDKCQTRVSGELDGHALETTGATLQALEGYVPYVLAETEQWRAYLYTDVYDFELGSSGGVYGVILTFPESPYGAAVYCPGQGSRFAGDDVTDQDPVIAITVTNLTKLGDCGGDDSLLACRALHR